MDFQILPRTAGLPSTGLNTAYLVIDNWNDYSFVTMFYLSIHDDKGVLHSIGNVKIGFKGQTTESSTYSLLGNSFQRLSEEFFSLGLDVDYYQKIASLPISIRDSLLDSLNDVVLKPKLINTYKDEEVFGASLLRGVSLSVIKGQFSRVLSGYPPLTNFEFKFSRPETEKMSSIDLLFRVKVESKPSTNIHAIIGRNGVGKTTLLNDMIKAISSKGQYLAEFYDVEGWGAVAPISNDYFSSLVSVSFSAFDPFEPPEEQSDPSMGTCYYYIGLKNKGGTLKDLNQIHKDFLKALKACLSQPSKRERWLKTIKTLESDENFERMALKDITNYNSDEAITQAQSAIEQMSSGHAVVLLTVTCLVATVEEKTLVLIDEPESHLHPPLLSAFIRALSELLHDRNGVAIIATHSPVVLQEMPRSCVWKIDRDDLVIKANKPQIETFGENVGVLTRDVFGLEVTKSGFHDLLVKSIESGNTYEQIVGEYNGQLGLEARALLKAIVTHRDRSDDIV